LPTDSADGAERDLAMAGDRDRPVGVRTTPDVVASAAADALASLLTEVRLELAT